MEAHGGVYEIISVRKLQGPSAALSVAARVDHELYSRGMYLREEFLTVRVKGAVVIVRVSVKYHLRHPFGSIIYSLPYPAQERRKKEYET